MSRKNRDARAIARINRMKVPPVAPTALADLPAQLQPDEYVVCYRWLKSDPLPVAIIARRK